MYNKGTLDHCCSIKTVDVTITRALRGDTRHVPTILRQIMAHVPQIQIEKGNTRHNGPWLFRFLMQHPEPRIRVTFRKNSAHVDILKVTADVGRFWWCIIFDSRFDNVFDHISHLNKMKMQLQLKSLTRQPLIFLRRIYQAFQSID